MDTPVSKPGQRKHARASLTACQIASRAHDHTHNQLHGAAAVSTMHQARLIQSGELDVELLDAAGLNVESEVREHPVLALKALRMVDNTVVGRREAIFETRTKGGQFVGHYFASAFKSLAA